MTNKEAFLKFRDALIAAIIADPDYKRVKAFGKFEGFIKSAASYTVTDERFIQLGTNYTDALDVGRGANKVNSGGLRAAIYDWLGLKKYGIEYKDDKERTSLSYAITKKIAKSGTYKHINVDKRTGIIQRAIDKTLPDLIKDLTMIQGAEVSAKITTLWQSI